MSEIETTIEVVETSEDYGRFIIEPLEPGFGTTLGSAMRRVLLGSLPGAAVTTVKVEGVYHEFTSVPHVKEDVTEFLLNVKQIRLRSFSDRPVKMRLEVSGEGEVCAGDIVLGDVVVNLGAGLVGGDGVGHLQSCFHRSVK